MQVYKSAVTHISVSDDKALCGRSRERQLLIFVDRNPTCYNCRREFFLATLTDEERAKFVKKHGSRKVIRFRKPVIKQQEVSV